MNRINFSLYLSESLYESLQECKGLICVDETRDRCEIAEMGV